MPDATLCPTEDLNGLIALAHADETAALARTEALAAAYPVDPRLAFLRGSLLASQRRYGEARAAMASAVGLAPDYALARFQLGLLELSSGLPDAARVTWEPLSRLPEASPLRLFSKGLAALAEDEFETSVALLRRGIEVNQDVPVLNRDMQMVIDAIASGQPPEPPREAISPAHLLLQQFSKSRRH